MNNRPAAIAQIARLLRNCKSILFITGAGSSADSGLPTYRGIGGLYNDKLTEDGIPVEMALAGETLRKRPEVTWKYLAQIEKNCRKAKLITISDEVKASKNSSLAGAEKFEKWKQAYNVMDYWADHLAALLAKERGQEYKSRLGIKLIDF